uniref:Ycf36 n=1 Tax=Gracilaria edulis TaxID=172966 RepID=A0A6C0A8N7_9FLOR|nr:hypothetical protein [Gracilaria edulis]QHS70544.1 hypothetical protein [Gracilaria edulis]UAD85614.1 hypothetical protein [Gracilaria edulis]
MSISKKKCPVPFDQQPLNEYLSLKTSWFFSWSTSSLDRYFAKLFTIFTIIITISTPLIFYTVSKINSIWDLVILNALITTSIFLLVFIRLYLGWSYVVKRLISATIFYEESGWYDGQLWVKTPEILVKDRIIGFYEVMPFLFRVKYSMLITLVLLFLEKILYSLIL